MPRDPSIDGDTQFKSSRSANEIYCHEVSNEPNTRVTNGIKEVLRYDVWRDIENYVLHREQTPGNAADRLGHGYSLYLFIIPLTYICRYLMAL